MIHGRKCIQFVVILVLFQLRCVRPCVAARFGANLTTRADSPLDRETSGWSFPRINVLVETDVELRSWRTVAAIACGAVAAGLSSAGGLGGGGLYVPIFNLLLGFDSKTSAALSSCMIFGGTLVNLAWYSMQRQAGGQKPLIDYQVALLCLPSVLLGISAGVMCNVMSPGWLVTALLILTLSCVTFRSCRGAFRRWNVETCTVLQPVLLSVSDACSKGYTNGDHVPQDDVVSLHRDKGQLSPHHQHHEESNELEKPLLKPHFKKHPQYPPLKLTMLALIWLLFLAVQLVRGSSDGQNFFNIETCGATYWIVTFFQVPLALTMTACSMMYLEKSSKIRDPDVLDERESSVQEDGYSVNSKSMSLLPLFALIAGLLGGMLGFGGGTIINPLYLEMGMHPQVTAATCSFVVFFSSSLSVVQFWLLGRIPEDYALASAALSLVFSVIGLRLIQTVIVKYGRVSVIVFSVSIVMGISAALMACFGSWDVWIQIQQGAYMGFRTPC